MVFAVQAQKETCSKYIHAVSAGNDSTKLFSVTLNGQTLNLNAQKGWNIVVFDKTTGEQKGYQNFDSNALTAKCGEMNTYISNIAPGDWVVFGILGDAAQSQNAVCYQAIHKVGGPAGDTYISVNDSFIGIGTMGMAAGQAYVQQKAAATAAPAVQTACIICNKNRIKSTTDQQKCDCPAPDNGQVSIDHYSEGFTKFETCSTCTNAGFVQQLVALDELQIQFFVQLFINKIDLSNFSHFNCQTIFENQQWQKFGAKPECKMVDVQNISKQFRKESVVIVKFTYTSTYKENEPVAFKNSVFQRLGCGANQFPQLEMISYIPLSQDPTKVVPPVVTLKGTLKLLYTEDLVLEVDKITNDGKQEFKSITWSFITVLPKNDKHLEDLNVNKMPAFNNQKSISIPKNSLIGNSVYKLKVEAINYQGTTGTNTFNIEVNNPVPIPPKPEEFEIWKHIVFYAFVIIIIAQGCSAFYGYSKDQNQIKAIQPTNDQLQKSIDHNPVTVEEYQENNLKSSQNQASMSELQKYEEANNNFAPTSQTALQTNQATPQKNISSKTSPAKLQKRKGAQAAEAPPPKQDLSKVKSRYMMYSKVVKLLKTQTSIVSEKQGTKVERTATNIDSQIEIDMPSSKTIEPTQIDVQEFKKQNTLQSQHSLADIKEKSQDLSQSNPDVTKQNEDKAKPQKPSAFYILMLFHELFGISLVYKEKIPRSVRYLFYFSKHICVLGVLSLFSLSLGMDIAVSLALFILFSIPYSLFLQLLRSEKLIAIVTAYFFQVAFLGGSIFAGVYRISDLSLSKSNEWGIAFVIGFVSDILIFQTISALLKKKLFLFTQNDQKLYKTLFSQEILKFYNKQIAN